MASYATVLRSGSLVVVVALATCSLPSDLEERPSLALTPSSAVVIVAAGDIAKCEKTTDEQTARVVDSLVLQYPRATVVPLGDLDYPAGTREAFTQCYTPSWGRFRSRTRPVVGSHEYDASPDATAYFDYFNGAGVGNGKAGPRGKGYYSWNPNAYWHVIVLNSNSVYVPTRSRSAQDNWLAADLAANTRPCILAVWHHPRFYSQAQGPLAAPPGYTNSLWQRLYAARADLILNASMHFYERFAPQRPDGTPDRNGIRQIIVGTGGASGASFGAIRPNSEVRGNVLGVLTVKLGEESYSWSYASVPNKPFKDEGTTECHESSETPSPPPSSSSIALTATGRSDATKQYMSLSWTGARGVSVNVHRNGAFLTSTPNDGWYVNSRSFTGPATYAYKVCETGSSICSNTSTVVFE